jgi:hypothetical protein
VSSSIAFEVGPNDYIGHLICGVVDTGGSPLKVVQEMPKANTDNTLVGWYVSVENPDPSNEYNLTIWTISD